MFFNALCRELDLTKKSTPLRVQCQTFLQIRVFELHLPFITYMKYRLKNTETIYLGPLHIAPIWAHT